MWRELSRANTLNPAQRHRWRLILGEVAKSVDLNSNPVIVDLGCGSGTLLRKFREKSATARLVGLDIEPLALDLARKAVPDAEFIQLDLSRPAAGLSVEVQGSADVVVCSEVLEHLDHPEHAVQLARTLLRPGGVFVVTVPAGTITPFDRAIGHVRHYDLPRIESLLSSGGFRMRRSYLWGFPFHTIFRMTLGMFRTMPAQWTDDHFGATTAIIFRVLDWMFFLNRKGRRWGRQIVAVSAPVHAA
jgi:SAM-dependent methyltransferase